MSFEPNTIYYEQLAELLPLVSNCCGAELSGHYLDILEVNGDTLCPQCGEHCGAEVTND
jgi:uncharacterized protein (UPF0212 family)